MPGLTHQARVYLYGAFAAAFNGCVNSLALLVIAPNDFNFNGGWKKLLAACGVSAGIGFITFLKQHPLPEPKDTDFQIQAQAKISQLVASAQQGTGDGRPVDLKLE